MVSQFEDLQACYLKLRKQGHYGGAEANGSMDELHSGMSYLCSTAEHLDIALHGILGWQRLKRLLIAELLLQSCKKSLTFSAKATVLNGVYS